MDVVFLHNEGAGQGDYSRAELMRLMRRSGLRPKYYPLHQALKDPRILELGEFVIVAGGDGSVRAAALALVGRNRGLAPLPLGTANNIARSVGLTQTPEEIIAGWSKPRRCKLDLGLVTGPWGRLSFVEGVGLGLFCRTTELLSDLDEVSMHEINGSRDRLNRDTVVAIALAYEFPAVNVRIATNGRRRSGQHIVLEVLNISHAGPGVELAPRASAFDGYFDVVGIRGEERSQLVGLLRCQLAERKASRLPSLRTRSVSLSVPAGTCRIDDRVFTFNTPANIRIQMQHGALDLLLPKRVSRN